MLGRFRKYVLLLPLWAFVTASACSDGNGSGLTGPSGAAPASITAEPETLTPEVVEQRSCGQSEAFGLRVVLKVGSREDIVVQRLDFMLQDSFGRRTAPVAVLPVGTSPIPIAPPNTLPSPSPIPGAMPVPLPGAPASGISIAPGTTQSFPFVVEFGCGVPAQGTLVVTVESAGRDGARRSTEVKLRVQNL